MEGVSARSDRSDPVPGEIPIQARISREDVQFAVRAVVVHAAEQWPAGPLCRNDRHAYPCRLARWGRRVLTIRGLSDAEIEALIQRGDPEAGPGAVGDEGGGR